MMIRDVIVGQFRKPTGFLGHLAGRIMAARPSNVCRNQWFVELMDVADDHMALEVGSGPGLALADIAAQMPRGHVVGLDHSPEMLRQAATRLHAQGFDRRFTLILGRAEDASDLLRGPFDRIGAVNVAQFWADPVLVLDGLQSLLGPDGHIVLVHQPRLSQASSANLDCVADRYVTAAEEVGLEEADRRMLDIDPAPVLGLTLKRQRRI